MPLAHALWTANATVQQVPKAMWGDPLTSGTAPPVSEEGGATRSGQVGARLTPRHPPIVNCTPEMSIADVFQELSEVTGPMAISPSATPTAKAPIASDSFADLGAIGNQPQANRRAALFTALQALGVDPQTDGDLSAMAAAPGLAFADEPMEVAPA
jgi:hypothetical protein